MHFELGKILAMTFLFVVAVGLVFAAFYARYSKPGTVEGRNRKQHVINGFRSSGGFLLGFVLVGSFVVSVGVGFFGVRLEPAPLNFSSKPLAFGLAALSLTFITLLVRRWAQYLGGWIGYGVLNGLLMVATGHLVTNPLIPIRRSLALTMTGIAVFSAFLCRRFTEDYELSFVDKIAVVGWVVCFAIAVSSKKYVLPGMALGGIGLFLAWFHHRLTTRPMRTLRVHRRAPKTV